MSYDEKKIYRIIIDVRLGAAAHLVDGFMKFLAAQAFVERVKLVQGKTKR